MAGKLSEETIAQIRRMHARGIPYREIGNAVGCSAGHVGKVVHPEANERYRASEQIRKRQCRPWTSEEVKRAVELRNQGWGDHRISRELDRTVSSVEGQLNYRRDDGTRIVPHKSGAPLQIPDWVLEDRDRRMSKHHTDLTAAFFGDPIR